MFLSEELSIPKLACPPHPHKCSMQFPSSHLDSLAFTHLKRLLAQDLVDWLIGRLMHKA